LFTLAAFAGTLAISAHSQAAPKTHDGFYLQLNTGLGYLSAKPDVPGYDIKYSGLTLPAALLMGGTVGPVVIGGGFFWEHAYSPSVDVSGQSQTLSDVTMTLIGIGMFADIYPNPQQGLHFQPFIGWGGLEASYKGNSGGSDPTGLVMALGGGYDFFVSDEWSIGPMLRLSYAPLKLNDTSWSVLAPSLLCTFTYH
jgi:hypothetical protein